MEANEGRGSGRDGENATATAAGAVAATTTAVANIGNNENEGVATIPSPIIQYVRKIHLSLSLSLFYFNKVSYRLSPSKCLLFICMYNVAMMVACMNRFYNTSGF